MKKIFVLTSAVLLVMFSVSCPKSERPVRLFISVEVLNEKGENVSKEVAKNLKCKEYINNGKNETSLVSKYTHENPDMLLFFFDIDLGYAYIDAEYEKYAATYGERMKKCSFTITGSSGVYRDIVLNPLPADGYKIERKQHGYPADIEYTVQLEKKVKKI